MKKILSIIMSLLFLLSFSSCSFGNLMQVTKEFNSHKSIYVTTKTYNYSYSSYLNKFYIDDKEYNIEYKDDKYYIGDSVIADDNYQVYFNPRNTILLNDKIYSLGIYNIDNNENDLYVFDKSFNLIEEVKIDYQGKINQYSYPIFLNLYDGWYIVYGTYNLDTYIHKIDLNSNLIDEKKIILDCDYIFPGKRNTSFQVKNFSNFSYVIMNYGFYRFSNGEFSKLSEEKAYGFGELSQNDWSFYTVEGMTDKSNRLFINKVSPLGIETLYTYEASKLRHACFANQEGDYDPFVLDKYLVLPIAFLNAINGHFHLGFLFFNMDTHEILKHRINIIEKEFECMVMKDDSFIYADGTHNFEKGFISNTIYEVTLKKER